MHFDELLPIYELFQIIFIDIDSLSALAAMTITQLAIRKKFVSFTVSKLSLLYTHLVYFTITQRPTVTRSGSLTQHSPWFRQQLAKRRTVLNMIALMRWKLKVLPLDKNKKILQ